MFPLIIIITLFSLAGFMGWLMHSLDDDQQAFKFFYFFLMLLFLLVACYQTSLLAYEPEVRLNYTMEDSHYWNCSNTTNECFGEPEAWSCAWYNETQCTDIDGCIWDLQENCSGTPLWTCDELYIYGGEEKCEETKGCYMWAETWPHKCDRIAVYNTYSDYDSQYESYGDLMVSIAWVLGIVIFMMLLIMVVTWGFTILDKYRKGGSPEEIPNEYGKGF